MDTSKLDAYHERIGVKPSRHPFTARTLRDGSSGGCSICPYSEGHATHQPGEVISLTQFRSKRTARP